MYNKAIIILVGMIVLNPFGFAFAADTVTLDKMNSNQSIGNQGVSELTNNTDDSEVNGLCVDKYTSIYFGDTVLVTSGTSGITNVNYVKSLIVNNYNENMTAQQGYDLQGAIWYFTDGIAPANNEQQAMINAALSDTTIYPDNYTMLYSSNTLLINIETTNTTELTNTITTSNSIITYLGEDKNSNTVTDEIGQTTDSNTITNKIGETTEVITETITSAEKICTKTTTTITDYFEEITTIITTTFYQNTTTENITQYYQNTTTTTTTNYYMDTLTTTDYYQTTNSYVNFLFNSVQQNNKQKLILFTTTYWSETAYSDNSTSEYNYRNSSTAIVTEKDFNIFTQKITTKNFNTTDTQTMTEFFNNITTTITWNCTPIPQNNTTIIPEETNNETVPMQDTGAPLIYLAMAGLIILGGAAIGRRK